MARLSDIHKAIILFISVLMASAIIIGIVRHISGRFDTFQIVFCYNFFALLCMMPWLIKTKGAQLKTTKLPFYSARALLEFVSFSLSFYSLTLIPIPMHTSLLFVTPIFGIIIAILVLKEKPTASTFLCVACGFIGVLVITRPGIENVGHGSIYALLAALGFAACGNLIKYLTHTENSAQIAFYMVSLTTLISAPFGLSEWVAPNPEEWAWLALIGVLAYSQQIAIAKALAKVPYTTVIPLNFTQLIFVSLVAYFVFNELIDQWTIAGSFIIIAGTLYNAYHSSKTLAKESASSIST